MRPIEADHPAPRRDRVRFTVSTVATILLAAAFVCDISSGFDQPRCPPGWTRWDFEPASSVILGIPLALLFVISGVIAFRARRARLEPRRGVPVATVIMTGVALVGALALLVFASNLIGQLTNPNAGCTTF